VPTERRELTRFAVPLAIGGAALALRFIGLSWGLPFDLHPDEPVILEIVERMSAGTLNPGFFVYPGFFIYQVYALGRLVTALGGGYPTLLYAARLLTATYSLATVGFAYLLGARLGGRLLGIVGAALVATMGALTLQAHYAVTDTPATALATATLWLSLRAWQRGSRGELLAAAALAGLAVSTKYSVAPVCVAPWIGAMALARTAGTSLTRRIATSATLAVVAVGAFLVTSPYTVLDYPAFLRDIRTEARLQAEARPGEHVAALQEPGLADRGLVGNALVAYHDMGPAALLLAVAMVGVILAGGPRLRRADPPDGQHATEADEGAAGSRRSAIDRVGGVMLVAWVLLYFAALAPSAKFGQRYALPMYPALMVLAAMPIAGLLQRERSARTSAAWLLGAATLVVAAAPPTTAALHSTRVLAQRDTRLVARDWILDNLAPGSRLAREFYSPPLHESDGFRLLQPFALTDLSFAAYCADGVDYLILSSLNTNRYVADPERFHKELAWYDGLDPNTRLVHRVEGFGDLARHQPTIEIRRLFCRARGAPLP